MPRITSGISLGAVLVSAAVAFVWVKAGDNGRVEPAPAPPAVVAPEPADVDADADTAPAVAAVAPKADRAVVRRRHVVKRVVVPPEFPAQPAPPAAPSICLFPPLTPPYCSGS